jgi:pimeloyl-ACP methyl ester carboxylesterase
MRTVYLPKWDAFIRYYVLDGTGDPIVYLSGLSFPSILSFLSVATHRDMAGRRAILVDNLGAGASDHPAGFSYSMADHAETVAAVLDVENLSGCTVVGHSMGGTVAIEMAFQRPDLVANLVVGEPNLGPGGGVGTRSIASVSREKYVGEQYPEEIAQWRIGAVAGDPLARLMLSLWGHADPTGLHGNSTSLVNLDDSFKDRFLNLQLRRTFIYGEQNFPKRAQDVTADLPHPDELREHGVTIGVVPEAGHLLMLDNLDGFVDNLKLAIS